MLIESGHLYVQHQMYDSAVQMYQNAYNAAVPGKRVKSEAQQGGAMAMAKQAKCDKGAKDPNCGKALKLFQEIDDKFVTGDAWWMRGQIHKNVYDDIQPAMDAMVAACARVDYNAAWWDKLARWSQMLHHRLGRGGFDNYAIKQGRAAMKRNHDLNPYSAPEWEKKVPGILEAQQSTGKEQGEFKCKNPIEQKGEGFLKEDSLEESVSSTCLCSWRVSFQHDFLVFRRRSHCTTTIQTTHATALQWMKQCATSTNLSIGIRLSSSRVLLTDSSSESSLRNPSPFCSI
eukprot:COSAG02_NODE_19842_length_862_cov_0.917431_1_plen_286_part_11